MLIQTKRIYEPASNDGFRILTDRIWPRGISKKKARLDWWAKDLAPSARLRRRFHQDGDWAAFKRDYILELEQNESLLNQMIRQIRSYPKVTLLFAAKDIKHNNAEALKEYCEHIMPEN